MTTFVDVAVRLGTLDRRGLYLGKLLIAMTRALIPACREFLSLSRLSSRTEF